MQQICGQGSLLPWHFHLSVSCDRNESESLRHQARCIFDGWYEMLCVKATTYLRPRNVLAPAYFAFVPSSSSIRINWLYFAVRSARESDPVLIWPQLVATARSAMVVS